MHNGIAEWWKSVPGYEGAYEVSDQGRIRSLDRYGSDGRKVSGRMLAPGRHHRDRHRQVKLCKGGDICTTLVHRIVLEAFVGPCPEGAVACHWDDDPDNNCLDNLRWGTPKDNAQDAIRNNKSWASRLTHCARGHAFAGDNLLEDRKGRACLACTRARSYLVTHGLPLDAIDLVANAFHDEIASSGSFSRKRRGREWFETLHSQRPVAASDGLTRSSVSDSFVAS